VARLNLIKVLNKVLPPSWVSFCHLPLLSTAVSVHLDERRAIKGSPRCEILLVVIGVLYFCRRTLDAIVRLSEDVFFIKNITDLGLPLHNLGWLGRLQSRLLVLLVGSSGLLGGVEIGLGF